MPAEVEKRYANCDCHLCQFCKTMLLGWINIREQVLKCSCVECHLTFIHRWGIRESMVKVSESETSTNT